MKKIRYVILMILMLGFASLALAADTPLGPGDSLKISLYGNTDMTVETTVSQAGNITYPLVGEVNVGGLSSNAAGKKIAALLEQGGFYRNPQINIIVTDMQSQQVSVLGQVNKPGRYPADVRQTLTDMLALAGGTTPDAGDTVILTHTENGKTTKQTIDMVELVRSSDPAKNPELAAGDTLYVERAPHFYIYGEVQKPGSYKLERGMVVLQALSIGGGLTTRGTERGLRIKRRDANGVLHTIDAQHDDVVKADDIVYVKESLF